MDIVKFLNETFWRDSGYMILTILSLVFILVNKKEDYKGKVMAIYTILSLIVVIYNPFVAQKAVRFFGDDMYAYLRIFYLLPLMTLIPYAIMVLYDSTVKQSDTKRRKVYFLAVISAVIVLAGGLYDKSMYKNVSNIYKIDQDALDISDVIAADCGEERVAIYVTYDDEVFYGIRQYSKNIMIVGNSDEIETKRDLIDVMKEIDFSYLVMNKKSDVNSYVEDAGFENIGESMEYNVYRRVLN